MYILLFWLLLYIVVSDINTPRLGGYIYIYVSYAIIVHIHFQRICVGDIIMSVLRYIRQFINGSRANKVLKDLGSL